MIRVLCILASYVLLIEAAAVLRQEDLILHNVVEQDTHLTPEDFQEARRLLEVDLSKAGVNTRVDPLLKANKFEGDIAGLNSSFIHAYIDNSNSFARNAIRESWRRWPNAEIPYVISSRYGTYSKRIIAKAMEEYHKKTCVRFVPRDEQKHRDYIYIFPDDGCYSLVGRTGGRQPVSLDAGCMQSGTIQHELMHAAGFFHEQSRSDRDDFIDIIFSNVQSDATDQFEKYSLRTITLLDLPYDYGSIMHYGPYAFTKNNQRTIRAKKPGADRMGQRDGFSDLDLQKLNKLYQCNQNEEEPGAATSYTTTTRRSLLTEARCENKKWQCVYWRLFRYCSSYPDYMREHCPKSCDMCDNQEERNDSRVTTPRGLQVTTGSRERCANRDSHCESWASKGFCSKTGFSTYMERTCPLACGKCTQLAPPSMASMSDD